MARGKNGVRRRSSIDEKGVRVRRASLDGPLEVNTLPPKPTTERYIKEVLDVIEFHWKNLSMDLKDFILGNLHELSLQKFVNYWRTRPEASSKTIAASSCGCSWYLALNYMSIGKYPEAQGLLLNGSFLQQCYNTPIEKIALIAQCPSSGQANLVRENLPLFTEGIIAITSEERMTSFLKNKVTPDYQRRMSFATPTDSRKEKVNNYVNQIANDWEGHGGKKRELDRRRASTNSAQAESFTEIKLVDSNSNVEKTIRCSSTMTLKSLFKQYAEDSNTPLRRLRFSYNGGTLFLSTVGNKTPQDLNMVNLDSIFVTDNEASPRKEENGGSSSSDESKENKDAGHESPSNVSRRKQCRRVSWAGPDKLIDMEEHLKLHHSLQLLRVFTEASPRFEQIRQKLNAMNLACSPPKDKSCKKKSPILFEQPALNPSNVGLGGKAGVPFHVINVGEAENLYKVTKPLDGKPITIDLHGLMRDEALAELDATLPVWMDFAMRGGYPWVISAVIICGGGNQILSETVDQWIKTNVNVAKAPKRKYSRRGTM